MGYAIRKKVMLINITFAISLFSSLGLCAEIVVGQIGPFTGLPSPDAHEINAGAQAYFDQINKAGGIGGVKISFFKLDDTFKPEVFKEQFIKAVERNPVALLSPIGSGALNSLMSSNLLDTANFVVINAIPGAVAFRNPGHPKLFHIRASDGDQFLKILGHARTTGVTDLQVLHQDLPIGKGGLEFVKKVSPEFGFKPILGTESKHELDSLAKAAVSVNKANPESLIVIGTPKFMADAAVQLRLAGFKRSINALSYMPASLVVNLAGKENARGISIAQTFPNPMGRNLPLQQDFQKTMAQFTPKIPTLTAFHLEGYLSARVLVDGLKRAKGQTSPAALSAALKTAGDFDYGGFRVNFAKSNEGSNWTDIGVVDIDGKLRY